MTAFKIDTGETLTENRFMFVRQLGKAFRNADYHVKKFEYMVCGDGTEVVNIIYDNGYVRAVMDTWSSCIDINLSVLEALTKGGKDE